MRWIAIIVLLASCSGAAEPGEDAAPVRLGTHHGVAVMDPSVTSTFTRNILEFVYKTPLSAYFAKVWSEGTRVHLVARDDVPMNLAQIAASLTHPQLVSATVVGREVVLEMRTPEAAASIDDTSVLIPDGPYRAQESTAGHLLLVRRAPGDGPSRIEVTEVPTAEEEWRRFLNGAFDVMPNVPPSSATYLREVPTIRLVRLSESSPAALWFRMDGGPTQDKALRHAIAGLLRRRAIAISVTGREADARTDEPEDDSGRATLLAYGIVPERTMQLDLIVQEAQSDLVRTAMVLQQQLDNYGIELRIEPLPDDVFLKRWQSHGFDLMLFAGDRTPRYYGNITRSIGYASPAFEAAVAAKDPARQAAILAEDLPLTPLFDLGESVAVRRELCNVHPRITSDLTWLTELQRCRPGEDE